MNLETFNIKITAVADDAKRKLDDVKKKVKETGKEQEKTNKHTSDFAARVKRLAATVLIWNSIRKAIRGVVSGLKEGISNAYEFSKANGGALGKAMDRISSKTEALKNSFGAVFANFITAAEPFITKLINALIPILNKASEVVAELFGLPTYLAAKDDIMKEWKQNNETTLKLISGLDELSILEGNKAVSTSAADMFEERKAGGGAVAQFKDMVSDFWNTKIKPYIDDLWDKVQTWWKNTAVAAIQDVLEAVLPFTTKTLQNGKNIWDLITGKISWDEFTGKSIDLFGNKSDGALGTMPGAWTSSIPVVPGDITKSGKMYQQPVVPPEVAAKMSGADCVADVVAQAAAQITGAIYKKDMSVIIGDEDVGRSAAKSSEAYFKAGGVPQFA